MDLLLLTCAESVVVDRSSNRVSLFHILEEFRTPTFPVQIPPIAVIAMISRTPRERSKVSAELLITLDKQTLVHGSLSIDFQTNVLVRAITQIQGLTIPVPGTLRFELRVKNKPLGEWRILVHDIGQEQIVPHPAPQTVVQMVPKPARSKKKKKRVQRSQRV